MQMATATRGGCDGVQAKPDGKGVPMKRGGHVEGRDGREASTKSYSQNIILSGGLPINGLCVKKHRVNCVTFYGKSHNITA